MDEILPPLSEEDRMLSGLCYPFWFPVAPLVLLGPRKTEPFVHYHALQGTALGLLSTVGSVLLAVLVWLVFWVLPGSALAWSGVVGVGVFGVGVLALLFYGSFVFYTAWRAAAGQFVRVPWVGRWAEERMRSNLGLTEESFSTEPLPRAPEREGGRGPDLGRKPHLEEPFQVGAAQSPQGSVDGSDEEPQESAVPTDPRAAEPAVGEERFQPGLFTRSPRPLFRWSPLEDERGAERPDEEPGTSDQEGFQAW